MKISKNTVLMAAGLLALGVSTAPYADDAGMRTIIPADPKAWQKDPSIPFGAKTLTVYGDPAKPGSYMTRLRMPSGFKMYPHKYSKEHFVTLVKGTLWIGAGERYNPMKMRELYSGSAFVIPAGSPTYLWARTEVILQILGEGPVTNPIEYVNPEDDPRQQ